jgi:hypothetical protein
LIHSNFYFYNKAYGSDPYIHTLLKKSRKGIVYLTYFKLILILYLQLIILNYYYNSKKYNLFIIGISSLLTKCFFLLSAYGLFFNSLICLFLKRMYGSIRFVNNPDVFVSMFLLAQENIIRKHLLCFFYYVFFYLASIFNVFYSVFFFYLVF